MPRADRQQQESNQPTYHYRCAHQSNFGKDVCRSIRFSVGCNNHACTS